MKLAITSFVDNWAAGILSKREVTTFLEAAKLVNIFTAVDGSHYRIQIPGVKKTSWFLTGTPLVDILLDSVSRGQGRSSLLPGHRSTYFFGGEPGLFKLAAHLMMESYGPTLAQALPDIKMAYAFRNCTLFTGLEQPGEKFNLFIFEVTGPALEQDLGNVTRPRR